MLPRLFEIPGLGIPINSYGVLIMIGFIIATFVAMKRCKEQGLNSEFALDLAIVSMIVGLVGAKIIYVIQKSLEPNFSNSLAVFDFGDGGTHPAGTLLGVVPLGIYYITTINKKTILNTFTLVGLGTLTVILAFLGARIVFLSTHGNEYNWQVFKDWQSGFVLYGGLLIGVLAGIWYTGSIEFWRDKRDKGLWAAFFSGPWYAFVKRQTLLKFADIAAPSIMLGLAFGRIGCFLNGCCFGVQCGLPWGVRFPDGSPVWHEQSAKGLIPHTAHSSLPVHPTQIYEALFGLIMFIVLSKFLKKFKIQGTTFLLMCILYSAWRFGVEFLRSDPERFAMNIPGLSFSQTISIFVFIICIGIFVVYRLRMKSQQETKTA